MIVTTSDFMSYNEQIIADASGIEGQHHMVHVENVPIVQEKHMVDGIIRIHLIKFNIPGNIFKSRSPAKHFSMFFTH